MVFFHLMSQVLLVITILPLHSLGVATYNFSILLFHSLGRATQSLFFDDCHFIHQGAPLNYCYFAYFYTNLCFLRMSPTRSLTFVLGVLIVRQVLPTRKSVCYISNNTHSASFSRFCPIWRRQPCCKCLPSVITGHVNDVLIIRNDLIEEQNTIAQHYKSNPKNFWKYVSFKTKHTEKVGDLKLKDEKGDTVICSSGLFG